MIAAGRRWFGGVLLASIAIWLAVVLLCYGLFYRDIVNIDSNLARNIVQATCGRVVGNELIYTLRPGTCRFENAEFDTKLIIDADGFRNAPEHLGSGSVRVAVLGDSYAMGWGVEQDEKLASILATDPRFQVRDLAMSSYGTARELFAFQRFAADADVVVVQYTLNDWAENAAFLSSPEAFWAGAAARAKAYNERLIAYRQRGLGTQVVQSVARAAMAGLATSWRWLGLPPRLSASTPQRVVDQNARAFARVMAHFAPTLKDKIVIVFDVFPRKVRVNVPPALRRELARVGMSEVIVLDLVGTLRMSDFFHLDDHIRASGHAKIAARIVKELRRSGRLPPVAR